MIPAKICLAILLTCCMAGNSWSQTSAEGVFVGSTPCDSTMRSALKFPAGSVWDHIIWELKLPKKDVSSFELTARYIATDPQTNMYVDKGIQTLVKGKYTAGPGAGNNPNLKFYRLEGENLQISLFLIEMDNNIFHFADRNKNLMVGNSGFGFVLNRLQN